MTIAVLYCILHCMSILGAISPCTAGCKAQVKLLLHPIVRVYTRKCAANIAEKIRASPGSGVAEIFALANNVNSFNKSVTT